ncbi:cytochrome c class I [Komagataeibacter diospyri]|uniref:Cytochrome c class I n=2 Tax=Komagataeibacter diospyri TaxID=1932662 RepID=A0A4P5NWH0_9PROT|nr:cytochrome c class I [Komagataeibacter diospyri]GCE89157.1 cytochrome c class I [Komagataeibacter diospyri]
MRLMTRKNCLEKGFGAVFMAASLFLSGGAPARANPAPVPTLDRTQTAYLTHCGGCHGIEGISGPTFVPMLRDAVGTFACSEEGRKYLVQVPGVSMSLIRDDQELADVMNFVLFQLGGKSTPSSTKPYTTAEIHEWRQSPMSVTDFMERRAHILQNAVAACQARKPT